MFLFLPFLLTKIYIWKISELSRVNVRYFLLTFCCLSIWQWTYWLDYVAQSIIWKHQCKTVHCLQVKGAEKTQKMPLVHASVLKVLCNLKKKERKRLLTAKICQAHFPELKLSQIWLVVNLTNPNTQIFCYFCSVTEATLPSKYYRFNAQTGNTNDMPKCYLGLNLKPTAKSIATWFLFTSAKALWKSNSKTKRRFLPFEAVSWDVDDSLYLPLQRSYSNRWTTFSTCFLPSQSMGISRRSSSY